MKGDEMRELTRGEILPYIENAKARIGIYSGEDVESVELRNVAIHDLRVHELALAALTARSEGFREGVEAAAKVCEDQITGGDYSYLAEHGHLDHMAQAATNCARAIRALSPRETDASSPPPPERP
jgi:hypothetical protein